MKTLIVVDDEPDNIHVAHNLLAGEFRIRAATSGEKCLKLLEEKPYPDLILLDMMMPGIDGFGVLDRLKSNPELSAIPVIMVSGSSDPADRERAVESGASSFLSKPIQPQQLRELIDSFL